MKRSGRPAIRSTISGRSTSRPCPPRSGASPWRELVQHRLDQRGLAGAARAGQQHVVGAAARDELARVLLDARLLLVDALQVGEPDAMRMVAPPPGGRGRCACASGRPGRPVGRAGAAAAGLRPGEQVVGAGDSVAFVIAGSFRAWSGFPSARSARMQTAGRVPSSSAVHTWRSSPGSCSRQYLMPRPPLHRRPAPAAAACASAARRRRRVDQRLPALRRLPDLPGDRPAQAAPRSRCSRRTGTDLPGWPTTIPARLRGLRVILHAASKGSRRWRGCLQRGARASGAGRGGRARLVRGTAPALAAGQSRRQPRRARSPAITNRCSKAAARRKPRYRSPAVSAPPDDLLVVDLAELYPELKNLRLRGRLEGRQAWCPTTSRAEWARQEERRWTARRCCGSTIRSSCSSCRSRARAGCELDDGEPRARRLRRPERPSLPLDRPAG